MLLILTIFFVSGWAAFKDALEIRTAFHKPSIVSAAFIIDNCVAPEVGSLCDSKDEIDENIDEPKVNEGESTTSTQSPEEKNEESLQKLRDQGCYVAEDGSFRWCQVSKNNIVQLCQEAFPELKQENGTAAETVAHGDAFSVTFNYPLLTSSVNMDGSQFRLFVSDTDGYSHRLPFCALPSPLTGKRDAYSVQLFFPRHDNHVSVPLKLQIVHSSGLLLMGPNGALLDASGLTFLKDEDSLSLPNGDIVDLMAWKTGQWLRMAKLFPFSLRGERLSDKNIRVQALTEKGEVFEGYDPQMDQEIPKDARVYPNHCKHQFPETRYVLRLIFIGEPTYDGVHTLTNNHTDWIHIYLKDGHRWKSDNFLGIEESPKVDNHLFELSDGDNIIDICLGDVSTTTLQHFSHVYLPCGNDRPLYLPKGGDSCIEHKVPIVASSEATGFEDFTAFSEFRTTAGPFKFRPADLIPDKEFQSCMEAPFCFGTALPGDFPNHGPYVSNRLFYARETDMLSCSKKQDAGWCERLASYQCWFHPDNDSPCPEQERKCKYNGTRYMRNDGIQNISSITLGCGACEWCANISGSNEAYWLNNGEDEIEHGFPEEAFLMISVCVGLCVICLMGAAIFNQKPDEGGCNEWCGWGEVPEEQQTLLGGHNASDHSSSSHQSSSSSSSKSSSTQDMESPTFVSPSKMYSKPDSTPQQDHDKPADKTPSNVDNPSSRSSTLLQHLQKPETPSQNL